MKEKWSETVQRCINEKWLPLAENRKSIDCRCALCEKSRDSSAFNSINCYVCPIYKITEEDECYETPYWKWRRLYDVKKLDSRNVLPDEMSAAAYEEIAFLYEVKIWCIENDY